MELAAGGSYSLILARCHASPLTATVESVSRSMSKGNLCSQPRMSERGSRFVWPGEHDSLARVRHYSDCGITLRSRTIVSENRDLVQLKHAATSGGKQQLASPTGFDGLPFHRRCMFPLRVRKKLWSRNYISSSCGESPLDWLSTASCCKQASDSTGLRYQELSRGHQYEKLKYWIIGANATSEVLAAATLRALLFYSYPKFSYHAAEDLEAVKARLKHEFHIRDLVKSRAKTEYERVSKCYKCEGHQITIEILRMTVNGRPAIKMPASWQSFPGKGQARGHSSPSCLIGFLSAKEAKMQSLQLNVKSLLAVCEESTADAILPRLEKLNCPSLIAPPTLSSPSFTSKRLVAIGTLDIQDGTGTEATVDVNLVTFQLFSATKLHRKKYASRPQISEPGGGASLVNSFGKNFTRHGYIFNLCVLENARRQGVATALMREAERVAQTMDLRTLYVHVDENNFSALSLYQNLGYTIEEEESFDVARRFHRPRRILLKYRF